MYLCVVNQADEIVLHREIPTNSDRFLRELAPYRADVVVCVECTFTWYWVADLCHLIFAQNCQGPISDMHVVLQQFCAKISGRHRFCSLTSLW
jgi:hypothetical protein